MKTGLDHPKMEQQSMKSKDSGSTGSKSVDNGLTSTIWDREEITFIHYLEQGKTIVTESSAPLHPLQR